MKHLLFFIFRPIIGTSRPNNGNWYKIHLRPVKGTLNGSTPDQFNVLVLTSAPNG